MRDFSAEVIESWERLNPELDLSPLEVVPRILRAAQLIQQHLDAVLATGRELSHKGDLDTLTALRRAGPGHSLSPSALAKVGQLTSGGMTNRLDRLESSRLVTRTPAPHDRRSVLVSLTRAGQRLADEAFRDSLAHQETLIAEMSTTDRRQLARILERLLVSLGDLPLDGDQAGQSAR